LEAKKPSIIKEFAGFITRKKKFFRRSVAPVPPPEMVDDSL